MKYLHVLSAFAAEPLAIQPEKLAIITDFLIFKADGGAFSVEELAARTAGPDDESYDPHQVVVTAEITAAILLLVGEMYETREADPSVSGDAVPARAVRALLAPYRVWRPEVLD